MTIDDDVAVRLERLRRKRDANLKDVVNETLRRGLDSLETPSKLHKPYRIKTFDGGAFLFPIDDVAEALAYAEGEDFK